MKERTAKVAVSLPRDLLESIEQAREKLGESRSAVFRSALRHWLKTRRERDLVRRYAEGYRRHPETEREIEEAAALSAQSLSGEDW